MLVQSIHRQDELSLSVTQNVLGKTSLGWNSHSPLTAMVFVTSSTELCPGFIGGMGVAYARPVLQTQQSLGENSKGFLSFYFQPETFTFSSPHYDLQRASLVIWWATCQRLLCTGPLPGSGKGSLPKPMAIRGSKQKNQELAKLLQGIFSFVSVFISKIGSQ